MADDRKIVWNLDATGGQQTAADFNAVNKQMQTAEARTRVVATRFTGVASASSAMGTALAKVNPLVGGLASAFGSAGGAVSGLVTATNPLVGLLAGGLAAAVSVAISFFTTATEKTSEFNDEMEVGTRNATSFAKALALLRSEREELARAEALAAGVSTEEQFEAQKKLLRGLQSQVLLRQKDLEEKVEGSRVADVEKRDLDELRSTKEQILGIDREIFRLTKARNIAQAQERDAATKAFVDANDKKRRREAADRIAKEVKSGRGGGGTRFGDAEEREMAVAELLAKEQESADARAKLIDDVVAMEFRAEEEITNNVIKEEERREKARIDGVKKLADEEKEFRQKQRNAEKAYSSEVEGIWQSRAQSGINIAAEGLQALVKGQEFSLAAVAEQFGGEMVAEGTRHAWKAILWSLDPFTAPFAGPIAAAAAAEIAAGLALGAAGSAGAPSGQGGAARPEPTGTRSQDTGGTGPIVVNINALTPDANAGLGAVKAIRAAQLKRGKIANVGQA